MTCRGIRGAITVGENTAGAILAGTVELLETIKAANGLEPCDVGSVLFTVSPDLNAAFPAQAARSIGWIDVPLLDAVEIDVAGSLPRCIRVLINWNTERAPEAIRHIYLREAASLRPEWAWRNGADTCGASGNGLLGRLESREGSDTSRIADGNEEAQELAEKLGGPSDNSEGFREAGVIAQVRAATRPAAGTAGSEVPGHGPSVIVAYQGEPGAYSQEAIFQHFGEQVETLACHGIEDIFAAVEEGRATHGLVPVENSQAGSITTTFDLLIEHDLRVIGEVKLRVRHCLLAPQSTRPADILRVYSHPQALAQCERYLRNHGWEPVPAYDTAGSARALAASGEVGAAAIASALAGRTYGLAVLEAGIEDSPVNTTRFFVLGAEEPPRTPNSKTSLVFATTHSPGALYRALGEFANRDINLTKIESRPRRNRPWHYVFYVDMEGHWQDRPIEQALVSLLVRSAYVKLLGSYPAAGEPEPAKREHQA